MDVLLALPDLLPLHMGALHPFEKLLTLVLAFGPFALLALVIVVRRRQDAAAQQTEDEPGGPPGQDSER